MLFWIIACALVALIAALFALAVLRRGRGGVSAGAYDMQVYRDQLREVERDIERGVLPVEQAKQVRLEISRKMLEADRMAQGPAADGPAPIWAGWVGVACVLGTLLAAFGLYSVLGAPGYGDQPIAARYAFADKLYANRPTQEEAEAARPAAPSRAAPQPEMISLMKQLREAVARKPGDVQGLTLLAQYEMRLGNYVAGHRAQSKLIAAKGDTATAQDYTDLGEYLTVAANDIITRDAEAAFAKALDRDPDDERARYYIGLMMAQNGRPDRAFQIWDQVLRNSAPDAQWVPVIRENIPTLAWLAGQGNYTLPPSTAKVVTVNDVMRAMRAPMPQAREAILRDGLETLGQRLGAQGGPPQDWAVMIAGTQLLGETDRATGIYGEAQVVFSTQADALALVQAAYEGRWPVADSTAPAPDQAQIDAAADMTPQDRDAMIRGMVDGLVDRLRSDGGSPEEWGRAVASLATLGDSTQATALLIQGRAALAEDATGLATLNAAATAAGITP
ncbi:c-type cytochrome biogenesis protein CcmI [Thioclava sp. SK-1]|nr:c-type cytochrome biogenesis protein CcmI [Thioclava sp. SK-1]